MFMQTLIVIALLGLVTIPTFSARRRYLKRKFASVPARIDAFPAAYAASRKVCVAHQSDSGIKQTFGYAGDYFASARQSLQDGKFADADRCIEGAYKRLLEAERLNLRAVAFDILMQAETRSD